MIIRAPLFIHVKIEVLLMDPLVVRVGIRVELKVRSKVVIDFLCHGKASFLGFMGLKFGCVISLPPGML